MQIQTFHLKFTSNAESGRLFEALRKLSLVDNIKSLFGAEGNVFRTEWVNWPAMGDRATCEA